MQGGVGEAVAHAIAENPPARMPSVLTLGIPDRFVDQGKVALLHKEVGLDAQGIAARIREKLAAMKGAQA